MKKKYNVICLCGSSKFKNEYIKLGEEFTLKGNIVLSLSVFSHTDNIKIDDKTKEMLDEMHKQKIDMSDEIFVINKDCYIGQSTNNEIEYAKSLGKKISYLE